MNLHLKAFLIKFVATFVLLYIILGLIFGMDFGEVLLLSVVLGVVAYLIGDMFILPRTNNLVATIGDFILAGLVIYLFVDGMTLIQNVFTITLIATIGVSLFEIIFHRSLQSIILPREEMSLTNRNSQYQTEMSEELDYSDGNKSDQ